MTRMSIGTTRSRAEFSKGTIENMGSSKFVKSGSSVTIQEDEGLSILFDLQDFDFDPEIDQKVEFCIYTQYFDMEDSEDSEVDGGDDDSDDEGENTDNKFYYDDAYQIERIDEDKGFFYAKWIESPYMGIQGGEALEESCISDAALDPFFIEDFNVPLKVGDVFCSVTKSEIRLWNEDTSTSS